MKAASAELNAIRSASLAAASRWTGRSSVCFSDSLGAADARAFGTFMRHLAETDTQHTVIMVQVENDVVLLGDSRDRSSLADKARRSPVPTHLLEQLREQSARLHLKVRDVWPRQGAPTNGTRAEVASEDRSAEEIFMACAFSTNVEHVAQAGIAAHLLPHYANAWLGPQPGAELPGQYPSGGPVAHLIDIWQIGPLSLVLLAPDICVTDFTGTLDAYAGADNPIFIPEALPSAANALVAVGSHRALGFSPFRHRGSAR